MAILFV